MGRKKIQIQPIKEDRSRQVTFLKRRNGLMKKAYELSVLCDCEVALVIMTSSNKTIQYSSSDFDTILNRFKQKGVPNEIKSNQDFIKADSLSKSDDEHKSQLSSSNRNSLEPEQGLQFISIHQAQIKQEKEEQEEQLKQRQLQQKEKYDNDSDDDDEEIESVESKKFLIAQPLQLASPLKDHNLLDSELVNLQDPTTYNSIQPQNLPLHEIANEQFDFIYSQGAVDHNDYMYPNTMDDMSSLYNQTPCQTPPASLMNDLDTLSTDHRSQHLEPRTTATIKKCPNLTTDTSVTQELFKQQQSLDAIFPLPASSPFVSQDIYYTTNNFMSPIHYENNNSVFQMPSSSTCYSVKQGVSIPFNSKRAALAVFDDLASKKIKIQT